MYCLHRLILVNIGLLNFLFSWGLTNIWPILTDPYRYIIALYDLYNVFFIDFDKKVLIIKVTLKKISFCLKLSKREIVTLLWKTLENLYFKILVYKKLQPTKVSMHFVIFLLLVFLKYCMSFILSYLYMNNLSNDIVSTIKQLCR